VADVHLLAATNVYQGRSLQVVHHPSFSTMGHCSFHLRAAISFAATVGGIARGIYMSTTIFADARVANSQLVSSRCLW